MHGLSPRVRLVLTVALALPCALLSGCHSRSSGVAQSDDAMPALAQKGKLIFDETPKYAGAYVGNKLSCNDCHLENGTAAYSAPMIDIAGLFPMFNKRAGHMISLENRIQECFARSEAGQPLPEESPQMEALVSYVDWLSRNGTKDRAYSGRGLVKLAGLTGDPAAGQAVYASQCAGCHGSDGAGAPPILPALWGPSSFNDGAGMNNPAKMAPFVFQNMPQNHPGTLTPQQAFDVSAYIHSKPRPKFNQAYRFY
jgi:thiosulfate dehydrogenase